MEVMRVRGFVSLLIHEDIKERLVSLKERKNFGTYRELFEYLLDLAEGGQDDRQ